MVVMVVVVVVVVVVVIVCGGGGVNVLVRPADRHTAGRPCLRVRHAREAKVGYLAIPELVEHDIRRFDVPMEYLLRVEEREAEGRAGGDLNAKLIAKVLRGVDQKLE